MDKQPLTPLSLAAVSCGTFFGKSFNPQATYTVVKGDFVEAGYVKVANASEIPVGKMKKVSSEGVEILIANVNGTYYAIGSECTHYGGDLSEGTLDGNIVTCPVHGAKFDLTTGKVVSGPVEMLGRPDIEDEPQYIIKIEKQDILIRL